MADAEDKMYWKIYQKYKKEKIKEIHTHLKQKKDFISTEGMKIRFEDAKEDINMIASRDAFIIIMDMVKNYYNGDTINEFLKFMESSYADKKDHEARIKINAGDYSSVEVFLKRYWFRNLKRILPKEDIKSEEQFYQYLDNLVKFPDFKRYGQHFWTLHSSHKGRDIYQNIYNLHIENIIKNFPLIKLNEVKIKDVNWIL
jgi:hypothetical protein